MRRVGSAAVAVVFAVSAFGQTLAPNDDALLRKAAGRVIVAFDAVPAARGGAHAATAARGLLERFHSDLARINRGPAILSGGSKDAGSKAQAVIRHEYSVTFVGAAVEANGDTVEAMSRLPYVSHVYRDSIVHALATAAPSDTVLVNARNRVDAGSLATLGDGVRVAVIDTGIDYTHFALGGGFGPGFKVAGGYDFVNDDPDPRDDNGHGTHVSGTIAGDSDSIIGVAPHATLYGFKVLDANGGGTTSDVIAGIERAADPNGDGDPSDHVDVANMSLGGSGGADDPQSIAVDNAVAAGVVMCVAAGNAGGFASIGTPGAARDAVTVGAIMDDGTMTSFSSRGPAPHSLAFKPDVVAPGYQVLSSWPGNSSRALNGTSMATPHVAGVAALIKSVHPDWSAGKIKQALMASATSLPGIANERGAGRVDAALASRQTVFEDAAGVSFGLDATADGTYSSDRTYSITNGSAAAVHMTGAATKSANGVTVTVTPSSFTIDPGQTQAVTFHAQASNATLGFPDGRVFAGEFTFTGDGGSTPLHVPWLLVRAARLSVTYDSFGTIPTATAPDKSPASFSAYADNGVETYVTPGKTWDIFFAGYDPEPGPLNGVTRILLAQNQPISGDATLALTHDDAPYPIALNARDEAGTPLASLPNVPPLSRHIVLLRFDRDGTPSYIYITQRDLFYASKLPGYTITVYQKYYDAAAMRFFDVRHDPLDGASIQGPVAVEKGIADYHHAKLAWRRSAADETTVNVCDWLMMRSGNFMLPFTGYCADRPLADSVTGDFFATPGSDNEQFGVVLSSGSKTAPPLRSLASGMVLGADATPGPISFPVVDDNVVTIGVGPYHPVALIRAIIGGKVTGFIAGALDDGEPGLTNGMNWEVYDDQGALLANGTLPTQLDRSIEIPLSGRVHASREGFYVDGHSARFDADMLIGNTVVDTLPPNMGSLRLLDHLGNAVEHVANGEAATLRFTVADASGTDVLAPKSDATTVSYRIHGTSAWVPLQNVVESTQAGTSAQFDHELPGDVNRVDLSPATAHSNALIDLQITAADKIGNSLVWTQSPAFVVGDVPIPPKRRAVR
jgi:subtilisin family serine protease